MAAVIDVIRQRIYEFDGASEGEMQARFSLEVPAKAALAPRDFPFTREHLLAEPQAVRIFKARIYDEFLGSRSSDGKKFEMIYDLALHHSRENIGRMFTWSLGAPEGEGESTRTISNDGGWLY